MPSSRKRQSLAGTFRYVDSAISYMLRKFETIGIRKNEMEVKLMGGADVFEHGWTCKIRGTTE